MAYWSRDLITLISQELTPTNSARCFPPATVYLRDTYIKIAAAFGISPVTARLNSQLKASWNRLAWCTSTTSYMSSTKDLSEICSRSSRNSMICSRGCSDPGVESSSCAQKSTALWATSAESRARLKNKSLWRYVLQSWKCLPCTLTR